MDLASTYKGIEPFISDQNYNEFNDAIHQVALLNEAHGANKYLGDAVDLEFMRMSQLDRTTRAEVHKTRHLINQTSFHTALYHGFTVMQFLVGFATLGLILATILWRQGAMPKPFFIVTVTFLCLFVLISIIIFIARLNARRRNNYKQFYWRGDAKLRNEVMQANTSTEPTCVGSSTNIVGPYIGGDCLVLGAASCSNTCILNMSNSNCVVNSNCIISGSRCTINNFTSNCDSSGTICRYTSKDCTPTGCNCSFASANASCTT